MTDKEFRQLKRNELIDIIYEYQKQEKEMKKEIESLREQLKERNLKIARAGSIAEATADLSGIFQTAQATAEAYLAHVKASCEETEERCSNMLADAKSQAQRILLKARRQAARYQDTDDYDYPLEISDLDDFPEDFSEDSDDDDSEDDFHYVDC